MFSFISTALSMLLARFGSVDTIVGGIDGMASRLERLADRKDALIGKINNQIDEAQQDFNEWLDATQEKLAGHADEANRADAVARKLRALIEPDAEQPASDDIPNFTQ